MLVSAKIFPLVSKHGTEDSVKWLNEKIDKIIEQKSGRDLFLTYSQLATKFDVETKGTFDLQLADGSIFERAATALEISRMYLLVKVLDEDTIFFQSKVATIIEIADTGELVTFLKFIYLLPQAELFKNTAVEALRTNIAEVFDAITLNNPYPATYFNDQQWNQMYLKAAFMERDLSMIVSIDTRANKELTRIISDYAHERWAATRKIDPLFWRPVTKFLNETLLADMMQLLASDDIFENRAGALCCFNSNNAEAEKLLEAYPLLKEKIIANELTWNTLKN